MDTQARYAIENETTRMRYCDSLGVIVYCTVKDSRLDFLSFRRNVHTCSGSFIRVFDRSLVNCINLGGIAHLIVVHAPEDSKVKL